MEIEIEFSSPQEIQQTFATIKDGVKDNLFGAMEALVEELEERIKMTFDLGGARDGEPEWLVIHNPSPLVDTGVLQDSIKGRVEEEGDDIVVVMFTNVPYAATHNFGDTVDTDVRPTKKENRGRTSTSMWQHTGEFREVDIPQREFLFLTDKDVDDIEQHIALAVEAFGEQI